MTESAATWFRISCAALLLLAAGCSQPVDGPFVEVLEPGSNPGELRMYKYVPVVRSGARSGQSAVAAEGSNQDAGDAGASGAGAPLVVVLHGCMQDAAGYGKDSGWLRLADEWGFLLLLPEQRRGNNLARCFSWYSPEECARDVGEALSIRQMIGRMIRDHPVDSQRIYVTGVSAGAAMSLALAAAYPELFAGAAPIAGIPYGCADGMFSGLSCMRSPPDMGADEWGDAVRAASGHPGPWPRISVWQGAADEVVNPGNADAIVRQWTDVHAIDSVPEELVDPNGYLRSAFRSSEGLVMVENYRIAGMGHGVPVDPGQGEHQCGKQGKFFLDVDLCSSRHIGNFWGLDLPAGFAGADRGIAGP